MRSSKSHAIDRAPFADARSFVSLEQSVLTGVTRLAKGNPCYACTRRVVLQPRPAHIVMLRSHRVRTSLAVRAPSMELEPQASVALGFRAAAIVAAILKRTERSGSEAVAIES
jgi:hypothetical protein